MAQPELYINTSETSDMETGEVTNEDSKQFLANAGAQFAEYAVKFIG